MGKREVFDCDHCNKEIKQSPIKILAFGYEYHLCNDCGSAFEGWIKPMALKLNRMKSEIVVSEL